MKDENVNAEFEVRKSRFFVRQRYVIAALGFFGYFNFSCMRNNINVTIVAMVNTTENNQTQTGTFNWDSKQQGLLLGSYFYGYAAGNIPGGWMAGKYGFRKVFGISLLISAICSVLTPPSAHANFYLVMVCRAMLGFVQGGVIPAFNYGWSKWAPPLEITILNSIALSGSMVGFLVIFPLAGVIAQSNNWEAVFYITGGMTTIWAIFFFIFASDAPSNNRWISEWEKQFIEKSIGKREVRHTLSSIPWKSIFTSKCAWGLFVCHSTDAWFQHTLPAVLPTYMSNVLDFDMTQIGLAMILPYLLQGFVAVLGSQITDLLRRKKVITTTNIRKISSFLSASMSGLFLVLTGYVGGNQYAVISLFTMSIAVLGLVFSGYQCNALDIAPRYSGIVYGISNTIAHIFAFFGPFSAGYIVVNKQSVSLWQNLFWLSFGINLTGVTAYAILGSGDEQPWAKADTCDNRSGKVVETENDRLTTTLH